VAPSQTVFTPPLGSGVVDVQALGVSGPIGGWAGRLQTIPASAQIEDKLTADAQSVEITGEPVGTIAIHVAVMSDLAGDGLRYLDVAPSQTVFTPPLGSGVVDVQALGVGGPIGGWAGRLQTTPTVGDPAFTTGLDLNSDDESAVTRLAVALLGPRVVRDEFSIDAPPSELSRVTTRYPAAVLQPLAGFPGRIPTAAEAKGLAAWAKGDPAIRLIEFGNETNYQIPNTYANGKLYGERAREAVEALEPLRVGLLVQASDAGADNSEWIDGVFVGLGPIRPAGWTIHPYFGGLTANSPDGWGIPMMQRLVAVTFERGDTTIPIYATEWGEPSSPLGTLFSSGQSESYAEAAQIVEQQVPLLKAAANGRLSELMLYQAHDQQPVGELNRELYFGALTAAGTPKQPFTAAVAALLAH
jgi:hypothetical protein